MVAYFIYCSMLERKHRSPRSRLWALFDMLAGCHNDPRCYIIFLISHDDVKRAMVSEQWLMDYQRQSTLYTPGSFPQKRAAEALFPKSCYAIPHPLIGYSAKRRKCKLQDHLVFRVESPPAARCTKSIPD